MYYSKTYDWRWPIERTFSQKINIGSFVDVFANRFKHFSFFGTFLSKMISLTYSCIGTCPPSEIRTWTQRIVQPDRLCVVNSVLQILSWEIEKGLVEILRPRFSSWGQLVWINKQLNRSNSAVYRQMIGSWKKKNSSSKIRTKSGSLVKPYHSIYVL